MKISSDKKRSISDQKSFSVLESTIEDIRWEMKNKNIYIDDLEKQRDDLEWNLEENRQWLQDASERSKCFLLLSSLYKFWYLIGS